MSKLLDYEEMILWPGTIFRLKGQYPYENRVDFMIYETSYDEYPLGLIVTTGYHAGKKVPFVFPKEAFTKRKIEGFESRIFAINKEWVISNWQTLIYDGCTIEDVDIYDGYHLTMKENLPQV
ncbi:Imm45 family immunity protein [Bartonella sp. HY038]|uniref:Imm45 family immunity protein n=1 Tax=Bartonella sp. HY038 TaxID=2759660 RepID=UPI0015FB5A4B|nr:Imm45 family immunity protein [Bartonella sp. HY038]